MRIGLTHRERVESLTYLPDLQDTADLEASTSTVTATSEASGVASADYSKALTLPAPTDARLAILKVAARLALTIDSMTATHLYCRVYVDAQDADHRLFDLDLTSTGDKLASTYVDATNKATIFNLLKDGSAHTFYFFFWVDSGNAILSVVQLWEGVGTNNEGSPGHPDGDVLSITHIGQAQVSAHIRRAGTGTSNELKLYAIPDDWASHAELMAKTGSDYAAFLSPPVCFLDGAAVIRMKVSVSNDIVVLGGVITRLRSVT